MKRIFALLACGSLACAPAHAETLFIEAENFSSQTRAEKRQWHLFSAQSSPQITPDGDPAHLEGASGGAYVEVLPDTRRSHGDPLSHGENFTEVGGAMAVLGYRVNVPAAGRYYVWVRAYSTTSEDNGLHFGLDGKWPESGARWQTVQKNGWHWDCAQRTEKVHTGVPMQLWLDVEKAGAHELLLSMREDGAEVDQLALTTDVNWRPDGLKGSADAAKASTVLPVHPVIHQPDGDGKTTVGGELKQWHKVTLTLDGPFARERDTEPNPFTDLALTVTFAHESGAPSYTIPGYFAADGNAAESGAESGTKWRAHLSPDKAGAWNYTVSFSCGTNVALDGGGEPLKPFDGVKGSFQIAPTDKTDRDFRAHGRLQYVGKHQLQFAGSKQYFLKAGPDAPETLLAYGDFDGTEAGKKQAPLKTWAPHVRDWRAGDPTWRDGKGKGLIGALNYLAEKGVNAFSFLTYNAGGDGDNVWPFVARDAKRHYDCSKLDQWGIVCDHATARGLYLHFKLQETEIDDHRRGEKAGGGVVPESLDGGKLGIERKLYCRELIARFGHALALNWNVGEENTQSTEEITDMVDYLRAVDPYRHHVVIHTYPGQQEKVYRPLLGDKSRLTGASLQNGWNQTHQRTLQWVTESAAAGRPWVVANDEQGGADTGVPPDLGYAGYDGRKRDGQAVPTADDIRRATLWGNLMAGGAGVEYYFGYALPENDLVAQDFRSRDRSWDYCRIALSFFRDHRIPFWAMTNANALIGNQRNDHSKYCLARAGDVYLVYLPRGGACDIDLTTETGTFSVAWFNPRAGGEPMVGSADSVQGGRATSIGLPPTDANEDWLALLRRR